MWKVRYYLIKSCDLKISAPYVVNHVGSYFNNGITQIGLIYASLFTTVNSQVSLRVLFLPESNIGLCCKQIFALYTLSHFRKCHLNVLEKKTFSHSAQRALQSHPLSIYMLFSFFTFLMVVITQFIAQSFIKDHRYIYCNKSSEHYPSLAPKCRW